MAILTIPVSTQMPNDKCVWRFTKPSSLPVKTTYHATVTHFSDLVVEFPSASSTPKGWSKIWALHIIPSVKLFLWKSLHKLISD